MNIKDILKRNSPVFFIGLITFVAFLIIIATSQLREPTEPVLIQTEEGELIAQHTNVKGSNEAPILVTAFYDFSHPLSSQYFYTTKELYETYPDYISLAIRHFPIDEDDGAFNAAKATQAAGNQEKFWEFVDMVFQDQEKLREGDFVRYADILNMDLKQFRNDLEDKGIEWQVNQDVEYGKSLGVTLVPTFFLNGKQMTVTSTVSFKRQVEDALKRYGVDIDEVVKEVELKEQEVIKQAYNDIYDNIDQRFGTKEIEFIDGKFNPIDSSATAGQLIRFTNNSENTIVLTQIIKKYDALDQDVTIKPGESFELRLELRRYGLWTYRNVGNPARASIMVSKLPEDIMRILPEED